jgi:WD40 repeat protein
VATHWWERGRMRVFLDEASLSPGDGLDDRLKDALDGSAALILLASKNSATSWWVREEVEHWRGLDRREVLIAHTGEGIAWPPGAADFDWNRTQALSEEVFGGTFTAEPAWVDLARARRHPRLHAGTVRDGAAALAAAILGVDKESLLVHERRRQRIRVATAMAAAVTAVTTVVVSLLASNLATQNKQQAQLNVAQHLLSAAGGVGPVDEAVLLTAAAYRVAPGSVARERLIEQADLNPGLRRVLRVPAGGIPMVWSVGYSWDGRMLAAAASSPSLDGVVVVWRGDGTGQPAEAVTSTTALATSVAFSPDGRLIAVGDSGGGITLVTAGPGAAWPPRLTTGPRLGPPEEPGPTGAGRVDRVSFAPDGRRLAASYSDGTTVVWRLATRRAVASFPGTASAFSPAGATLASLEPAGTVAVRDAGTLALLGTYPTDVANPAGLAYRPDGKMIAVTSGTVSVSSTRPTVAVVDIAAHTTHPIDDTLGTGPVAYGGGDEVATDSELIPAASTARPQPIYRAPRMAASSIAFDPAGELMAAGGSWYGLSGGAVLLLSTGTAAMLPATIMPPGGAAASPAGVVPTSALSPDGRALAVTRPDGAVELQVAATGALARPALRPGVESPARLAFSPDGTELAGINGRTVTIWSLRDGTAHDFFLPLGLAGHEAGGLAFSPDGRLLAVTAPDGQIMLLRTTFPITATSLAGAGPTCDLAFSPDGRYLAAATPGGAQLWDTASRQRTATLTASPDSAAASEPVSVDGADCTGTVAVSFVLGGTKLAATDGHTITIWTLANGARASLPSPLLNPGAGLGTNPGLYVYTHLAASPDGDLLAAGTDGGTVFLWDMTTQRQVGPGLLSTPPIAAVGFGPGGNTVLSFGAYATAWNINPQYWLTWACNAAQRNLTAGEWNLYGTGPRIKECDQWPQ